MTRGIVRNIDALGRLVIPMEFRRELNVIDGDAWEMTIEGGSVVCTPKSNKCVFCGGSSQESFKGQGICVTCKTDLKS